MSVVTLSTSQIEVGASAAAVLHARDEQGNDLTEGGLEVVFIASGGSSQGSFGATTDHGDGTYEAIYTGTSAGTPTTIGATIEGAAVTSDLPTIQVMGEEPDVPPGVSPSQSVVTISANEIEVGQSITVELRVRDEDGNDLTEGGLTVAFAASGGSSQGTFSATIDNGDGTYEATYTGTYAGSATTIGATIEGAPVTSDLPAVQVLPAPTPPGEPICEATGGAQCWYVAAGAAGGGDGSYDAPFRIPQDAVHQAGPGDFIYLRGGADFTHAHTFQHQVYGNFLVFVMQSEGSAGAPGQLITLKSYPGEQAVVRGTLTVGGHIGIKMGKSHWRVEGLRVYAGALSVGHSGLGLDVEDVWVVGNHFSDVVATAGNFGIINVTGQQTQGGPVDHSLDPTNIYIHDNVLHTLWGEQPDGSVRPWNEDVYIEHHACFMLQKSGGHVELVGNEFYECAAIFYSKWQGPGPTVIRDNYFHTAQGIAYRWRSDQARFEDNVFARFVRTEPSVNLSHGDPAAASFRRNVFDFAPWPMNPQGSRGVVEWNSTQHLFRDNVVLAPQYHEGTPISASDIDNNCVIWSSSLVAVDGYSWDQYQSTFGHDANGVRVLETDRNAVFSDPDDGDFTMIGQAATQCAAMGPGS